MDRDKLIKIFRNIAVLLQIKGENPFKARAYSNAADILEEEDVDIADAVANGSLREIEGIGKALQSKITEFVQTGNLSYYDKLIQEIPESLVEIPKISTLGPKKAKLLYDKLGVKNLDDLEKVCLNGDITKLKGFTEKNKEIILNSIHHFKASRGKFLYNIVMETAQEIEDILNGLGIAEKIKLTGDLRRFSETPTVIEFVAVVKSRDIFVEKLSEQFNVINSNGFLEFQSLNDIPVKIYFAENDNYGTVLHTTTGSNKFINSLGEYIRENNIMLGGKLFPTEKEYYSHLNLQYIEPELRESSEYIERAKSGNMPRLIEFSDLRGIVHVHTNWSDGQNTIEEMALKAKELGHEYIVITDHSHSAYYANGLSSDDVLRQHEEIDRLNDKNLGIKIFKGIESDILPDGELDYPESILKTFDLIIASVHSSFNMTKADMTKRIKYALMSPYTSILGHPTGRLLLTRAAYELDIEEIINCAAEEEKIIEINCNPYRLDFSWENIIKARRRGVKFAINPDSHNKDTMVDVEIGVKVARKGRLQSKDVINTKSRSEFLQFLNSK